MAAWRKKPGDPKLDIFSLSNIFVSKKTQVEMIYEKAALGVDDRESLSLKT